MEGKNIVMILFSGVTEYSDRKVIILPFQSCDRIFQRVTSDSIKCNGSFVRSLHGRICRGGQGGDREIARDRGWLRGVVWSGRVGLLHVCTNHN